jgi:hypothetical protein
MQQKRVLPWKTSPIPAKRHKDASASGQAQTTPVLTPSGPSASRSRFECRESTQWRAQEYRIVTARMPLRSMTCTWSSGTNRPLDPQHVRRLREVFTAGGVDRSSAEHHLIVQCDRADVERMLEHLRSQPSPPARDGANESIASFQDWLLVNPGKQVEVMAGQHRIAALEEYVRRTGAPEDELWWTCVVYDKGTASYSLR